MTFRLIDSTTEFAAVIPKRGVGGSTGERPSLKKIALKLG